MNRSVKVVSLFAALCTSAAIVPTTLAQTSPDVVSVSPPVAYVYVSSTPTSSTTNVINAYAAATNGTLTLVPGSPFHDNVTSMAVNGQYLFG
jgi:hypothetical protein